jgi:predicted ATPase/transcriptional regulator with XRE-family HTH domain
MGVSHGHKKGHILWRNTLAEVSFGEWLKRGRKAAGLTQEQLALQINCSTSAIKKIESEERHPSAQIIEQLTEVFGIPADEQTSFLRFARGHWAAAPVGVIKDAPWRFSAEFPRCNLPASLTALIGREHEIASISEYLSDPGTRLVTLMGPPGIGKTRLSVEVARQVLSDFPDGVFFIALAPLDDPNRVAQTVVQTLGFVEMGRKPPFERLKDGIGDKHMLLVLDNLEHLIEDAATLVGQLLVNCPRLKILTTSREALRVPGEWLYPVPVLNIPTTAQLQSIDVEMAMQFAALTLFAERARALRPDFVLNADNIQAVANICAQLDGLPLAIELIAARIRLMSPQALLERLSSQFTLYADGMRAVSARQKTLHNAIAWSYDLLADEEQKLFAHLSVFIGGFTLDAAESVYSRTSSTKTVPDLIASLLDKSLFQRTFQASGEPRFTMLVTIQQFARDQLRCMGDETEIQNRHLAHFVDFAERANQEMHGPDQFRWLDRLEVEHDNLRAAWDYAIESDAEVALRLASALLDFWSMRGNPSEGRQWSAQLLERTNEWGQTVRRARLLGVAGWLAYHQYDLVWARQLLEEALSIARTSGDEKEITLALFRLTSVAFRQKDYPTAQSYTEEYSTIYEGLQDPWITAWAMHDLAVFATVHGRFAEAQQRLLTSLSIYQDLGDRFDAAYVLNGLGEASRLQDNYEQAGKYYEENLAILRELRSGSALATPVCNLGWVLLHQGDYRQAQALFGESLKLSDEYDNKYLMAINLAGFAGVLGMTGEPEPAVRIFGAVESVLEVIGMTGHMDMTDQRELDHYVAVVRSQLNETVFAKTWAEGRAMTIEQAIAYALEKRDS